ncbi:MAG: hypothetical protein HEQ19_25495 [Gloeotrichia echinulata CP02]
MIAIANSVALNRLGTGDWGLGTLRQAQCIAGDWGLGTGDTSASSVHRWGLGTGDWGHFGKLSASLGTGDWGLGTGLRLKGLPKNKLLKKIKN